MAYKSNMTLKVCEQSDYRYKPTPTITLKGKRLEELSFPIRTPIIVKCEDGVLTIRACPKMSVNKNPMVAN